jgi:hypothetical protein
MSVSQLEKQLGGLSVSGGEPFILYVNQLRFRLWLSTHAMNVPKDL